MDTYSNFLLKTLAVTFAILFVVTTALALTLFSVEQGAFNAELYKQALIKENVYQRLPEQIAQMLATAAQQPGRNDMLSVFRNLSEEEWRAFVSQLLSPDELRILAEDTVTQVMAYLNGESDSAILSLSSLKAHLASPEGVNAVYGLLKAQPDCSAEQIMAMAMGQPAMVLCNPPDTFLFIDLRPVIEAQIKAAISLVPEQVTLISPNEARSQNLRDLKTIRTGMRLSPLVPFLCLLMITALIVRSTREWLVWWGYPLLIAGIASLLLSVMSRPLATWFFRFVIYPRLPVTLPASIVDVFGDLVTSAVQIAMQPIIMEAGVITLTGLVMVAAASFVRGNKKKRTANLG